MSLKMNNPLVSVIVPVFRVEKYLDKCVGSIVGQSYKNLEIILVDDGSPDNCGVICDKWSRTDNRIIVIHKQNGGLSDARNAALDIMSGQYVTCVDSDDYISPIYIEKMMRAIIATKADIAVCNYNFCSEKSGKVKIAFPHEKSMKVYERYDALKALLYQRSMETGAWGKLYLSILFKDVRYPKGRLFEDICTTYLTYMKADKVVLVPEALYYYILRDTSIMGQPFSSKKMDAVFMAEKMLIGVRKTREECLIKAAICRYVSMCFNTIFLTPRKSEEEYYIFNEILKYRTVVLGDKEARYKTRIAVLLSFGGVDFLRFLYSFAK